MTGRWWLGWVLTSSNGTRFSPTVPRQIIGMPVAILEEPEGDLTVPGWANSRPWYIALPYGRSCVGKIIDARIIDKGKALFLTAEVVETPREKK